MVALLTGSMGLIAFITDEQLEEQVLDEMLSRETDQLKRLITQFPDNHPTDSVTQRFYMIPPDSIRDIPAEIAALDPGLHHSITANGRSYHVSRDAVDGRDIFITYDITDIETREKRLRRLLFILMAGSVLVAVSAGYAMSRITVTPVMEFARRVRSMDPAQRHVSLSKDYGGYELGTIAEAFDHYLNKFVDRERSFTEGASHELRTPLTVIGGAVEIMLKNPALDAESRAPLLRIRRACDQMVTLTESLLFLARDPDAPAAVDETWDLEEVVTETVASYRGVLESAGIRCTVDARDPDTVVAPATALEIVVGNLLRNVVAHVPGGTVDIRLEGSTLAFADSGPGIAPEDLGRIFERHFKGSASRGSGLGLYIVKEICDRYGWGIDVASAPGEGTTFTLTFPSVVRT